MGGQASRRLVFVLAGGGALALVLLYLVFGRGTGRFSGPTGDASILLITCDALRADHVGAYGARESVTPVLDTLADEGVLFEAAFTPAVATQPAHASILTGTYPASHGVRADFATPLPAGALTLAEVMRSRGVKTGAVVSSFLLDSRFGMDQGFEWYDDALPAQRPEDSWEAERQAGAVTEAALRFLRQAGQARFFLWVHYADPGRPWRAPESWAMQHAQRPYDAEVAYMDAEIGRLFAGLRHMGLRERTLIALAGDHGEGLGDHGESSHGVLLNEETTRVPLIISFPPHIPSGRRVGALAGTVDLMPTLLDLIRINPADAAAPVQGSSLWPLIADTKNRLPGRPVFSEAMTPLVMYGWSPLVSLRDADHRFVEGPRPELYDVRADPAEKNNLAPARAELVAAYRARLAEAGAPVAAGGALPPDPGIDPKERLSELAAIERVADLYDAGQYEPAVLLSREILGVNPELAPVRSRLAGALARMQRYDEAIQELRVILERSPGDTLTMSRIGWCLYNQRRFDEAAAQLQQVMERSPDDAIAATSLGDIAFVKGDQQAAGRQYIAALKLEPNYVPAIMAMGQVFESRNDHEKAAAFYVHAAEVDPANLQAWLNLGWVRLQMGKPEEAVEALSAAVEFHPDAPELQLALGDLNLELGRLEESAAAYSNASAAAPTRASAHHGLGMIALKRGDARLALQELRHAVAMRPDKVAWLDDLRAAERALQTSPR